MAIHVPDTAIYKTPLYIVILSSKWGIVINCKAVLIQQLLRTIKDVVIISTDSDNNNNNNTAFIMRHRSSKLF